MSGKEYISADGFKGGSFGRRLRFFSGVAERDWSGWLWQQQNAVRTPVMLKKVLEAQQVSDKSLRDVMKDVEVWVGRGLRFQATPHVLSLIDWEDDLFRDPVFRQVLPCFGDYADTADEYSPGAENWEEVGEMISPIAQHKYDNRVNIYLSDCCLGYCNYCFRSLVSNASSEKHGGNIHWRKTIEEIARRPQVEEVILSGGDPLVYDNSTLEKMLKDLRLLKNVTAIRIHTRAWTHNPFRIDDDFCRLLKKYEVTVLGVHVIHPREITVEFKAAVERIRASGAKAMLLADIPLIKGINDSEQVLRDVFMRLYLAGVKPYYLSHNMPNIPFAGEQRTSVRKGVELMNKLKRRISNGAMPEYIITGRSGKKTVPACPEGTPDFIYARCKDGRPIIRFRNWKGEWVEYQDGE